MRRAVGLAMMAVLVAIVSVACGGESASSEETSPEAAADVVRDIERERIHALVVRDLETAGDLHADDFRLTTPPATQ